MHNHSKLMAASAICLILGACATTSATTSPIGETVETSLGTVRGESITENGVSAYIYKGIPYAAPPVGDLRWKAPQPPTAWSGVLDATDYPTAARRAKALWALVGRSAKTVSM